MARKIEQPARIQAEGKPPKQIEEFIGKVASQDSTLSVARMISPPGWSEPGQTPEFHEYSLVLHGELQVETKANTLHISAGQAVHVSAGEWVRYSTPGDAGAEYIAVCLPAFSPETVHRDDG